MRKVNIALLTLTALLCAYRPARAVVVIQFPDVAMQQNQIITFPVQITASAGEEITAVDLHMQVEDGNTGPFPYAVN